MARITLNRSTAQRRQRERELASDERAGVFAHEKARTRQRRVFLRLWPRLLAFVVAVLALSLPPIYLVPDPLRGFFAGLIVASVGWLSWWLVVLLSGTAHTLAGEMGEQWTADELRKLRRSGWKVINGLMLRSFDIDHIAIGPGGVLVVETKWSAEAWRISPGTSDVRVGAAVKRLRRSALDVQGVLRPKVNVQPRPILMLWGPEYGELSPEGWRVEVDGVQVLTQPAIESWRKSIATEGLSATEVEAAWRILDGYVRRREEGGLHLLRSRGLVDRFIDMWLAVVGFGIGIYAASVAWKPLGSGLIYFGAAIAAGCGVATLRMLPSLRWLSTGALLGLELIALMLAAWTVAGAVL